MTRHDGTQRPRTDGPRLGMFYYVALGWNLPDYGPLFMRFFINGEWEPMLVHDRGWVL